MHGIGKNIVAVVICLLAGMVFSVRAQEIQFSQFYANPMYLNPAFAGNTIQDRFAMNYRNQWGKVPGAFRSFSASYDHNFDMHNGLGAIIVRDAAGSANLNFTSIALNYSYNFIVKRNLSIRAGLGSSYAQRSIDYSKLIFPTQLTEDASAPVLPFNFESRGYFDFSSGFIVYSRSFWAGVSVFHLNKPVQNVTGSTNNLYHLPIFYTTHAGYMIPIKKDSKRRITSSVTGVINYKAQAEWDQLDLGAYFHKDVLVFGTWYRGLPFIKWNPEKNSPQRYINQDALVFMVGLEAKYFRVGYSYDVTISKLAGNTGGSHEISLIYEWAPKKKRLSYRRFLVPCAKF